MAASFPLSKTIATRGIRRWTALASSAIVMPIPPSPLIAITGREASSSAMAMAPGRANPMVANELVQTKSWSPSRWR